MGALLKVVGTLLIGFAGVAILAWGWVIWLPAALAIGEEYGLLWRGVALAVLGLLSVAIAWGLWKLQDWLARGLDHRDPSLRDQFYCQRCGRAAASTAVACADCGGTRFGLTRPGTGVSERTRA
ncbi:MAG: hypothetical protein ACRDJN_29780 [Chloroflexota bacterium]